MPATPVEWLIRAVSLFLALEFGCFPLLAPGDKAHCDFFSQEKIEDSGLHFQPPSNEPGDEYVCG